MIEKAKISEIPDIKRLVDSFKEMDVIPETFPEAYYKRILKKGILLIAKEDKNIIGVCFGAYNTKEGWADLLGLVVRRGHHGKGIGSQLVRGFEDIIKEKKLKTIDLYADKNKAELFRKLGYTESNTFIAFRKKF